MYYRQHKFNLLAEESEGYAKLLGYYMSLLDHDYGGGTGAGAADTKNKKYKKYDHAKRYVRELIGVFDLDPNRVLDLALDVLEWQLNELVNSSKSSNKSSSSTPTLSFAELNRSNTEAGPISGAGGIVVKDGNDDQWWGLEHLRSAMSILQTSGSVGAFNTVHSLLAIIRELDGGNDYSEDNGAGATTETYRGRAVAHLLGFKFRSYRGRAVAKSAAVAAGITRTPTKSSDASTTTATVSAPATPNTSASSSTIIYPRSLYLLAAFLCARGILDPHALLPHLVVANNTSNTMPSTLKATAVSGGAATTSPLMQAYQTHCVETVGRLKKIGVMSLNAANSGTVDETNKEKKDPTPSVMGESVRNDPVVVLFRALLALDGDWDAAAAFLAHGIFSNFAAVINGGGGHKSDDAFAKMRSAMGLPVSAACTLSEGVALDVCAWVWGAIEGFDKDGATSPLTLSSRKGTGVMLPKDSTIMEISSVLREPLSALVKSGMIRLNQNLYTRLCRLYAHKFSQSASSSGGIPNEVDSTSIDSETLSVLSTFLIPSLSLFPSDTILPNEVWAVLKYLPYELRYKLYSAWRRPGLEKGALRVMLPADIRSGIIPKPLGIVESEIVTGIAARYVLKRISKENIMGHQLAKTSHNNPLVVFTDILGKIESYDNLILMMVDTFQFVTKLGLDVMGYCLLESLGGGEVDQRNRRKVGGLNTEQWLISLETFIGAFYKKFPYVEMRGILQYITKRFKEGQASELGVLRSLIKTVGGYGFVDYDATASLSDLQLDGRRGSRLLRRETSSFGVVDDINREASQQLRSVLQREDLGVIILLLLSQIRSRVLYSKPSDKVQEHVKVIGNIYDNCEAVMCLLLEFLSDSSDDATAKEKFAASMPSLVDLHTKYGVEKAVAWMLCRPLVRKSMFYKDDNKIANKASLIEPPAYLKPFTSTGETSLLPEGASKYLTPTMYENFYSLAIYDISCPEERYNLDIDRLKKDCDRLIQLQKGGDAARGQMSVLAAVAAAAGGDANQIRQATAFTKTHETELERLKGNVDQLNKDFQRQQKRCQLVNANFEAQKGSLILTEGVDSPINSMFAPAFMTFCVYPRCFLSPEDSLFCAHFIKLLHNSKVTGFPTIEVIDIIVDSVIGSLFCMTEDEAGSCSIFLNEIWKSVNSWRYDNDVFASELKNTSGSRVSREFSEEKGFDEHASTVGITHEDYKTIYSQWHKKLGSAAIGCLKSSEYMHTRAALIVLSRIVLVFPTQPKTGDQLIKALGPLQNDDEKPDIRATAKGYVSQLMKARDEGMWKEENIAVTKARQEREKMKAEEKKKKLAMQHEEMKKESEMISKQLGDSRDSWRPDRRDGRESRPYGIDARSRQQPLSAATPSFTPKNGGEPRELHARPGESRRLVSDREAWERDRGIRQPENRDTRRQSGDASRGERRKRSRSPEPGEDSDHQAQKRSRGGSAEWAPPPPNRSNSDQQQSSGGGRGGGSGARRR